MKRQGIQQPIKVGKLEIKNRIALAPMGTRSNLMDGTISERCSIYLEERAKGGAGLIIPEFTAVKQGYTWIPSMQIYSDRLIPSLSRLADSVHNYDSKIIMQLAHHGGRAASAVTGQRCVAPSAIASPLYKEIPEELTKEEIYDLVNDWKTAAFRAKRASFDGVEVHGCHGYLINQFISPSTNKRTDEFGGCLENRLRFAKLIVSAIREACGPDFIIGFKFAAYEELEGGVKLEDAPEIAKEIEKMGVDYIHVSSTSSTINGHPYTEYPSVPSMYDGKNCLVPLAKIVKEVVSIPVMLASGIVDPKDADELVESGVADIVAVGRGFLAEPHWGLNPRIGKRVRPCIGCMTCHKHTIAGTDLTCAVNGGILREFYDVGIHKTDEPKNVMVIGGGPGGMETAIRLHDRGHKVTIYEKCEALGGALRAASLPAFKSRVMRLLEYYLAEVGDRDIRVIYNADVTTDNIQSIIEKEKYDSVVVSVGGDPFRPPVKGIENALVAEDVVTYYEKQSVGDKVIVLGSGKVGLETAWFLREKGKDVSIVEFLPMEKILADDHPTTRSTLFRKINELEIPLHAGTKLVSFQDGKAEIEKDGKVSVLDADTLVLAAGYRSNNALYKYILENDLVKQVFEIGDGKRARGLYSAIHEAYFTGTYSI